MQENEVKRLPALADNGYPPRFPFLVYPAFTPTPGPSAAPSAPLPLILVADDVPENRQLFTLYLRREYRVEVASTAEEAIAKLLEKPFDAALLDINYGGGMDGFDAIRAIRSDPRLARIPTAALTAHVAPEDRDECLAAGFDVFIAKPVRRAEMKTVLEKLLSRATPAGALASRAA